MSRTTTKTRAPKGTVSIRWDAKRGVYAASQRNPNPAAGGPVRLKAYAKDYDEALEKLRQKVERARRGLPTAVDKSTVNGWLDYWLENIAKRRCTPKTFVGYESVVNAHIRPLLGERRKRELKVDEINAMYDAIVVRVRTTSKGRWNGISTARLAHRVMHTAFQDAYDRDEVDRNVVDQATPPDPSDAKRRAIAADNAKLLLRTTYQHGHPYTVALAVLLFTGVRLGEVLGLTWDRVQLSDRADGTGGWLDFEWQLQSHSKKHGCGPQHTDETWPCGKARGFACPEGYFDFPLDYEHRHLVDSLFLTRPKQGGMRMLPATPQLNAFLMLQAQKTLGRPDNPHNLVFIDPRYTDEIRPLPPRYGWVLYKECAELAGLPADLLVHETRHTTATLLHEAGVDPKTIQMILGHTDVATTMIYTHIGQAVAQDALNKLDAFLGIDTTTLPALPAA
ncbi:tyrosine-type recombinase/integrase [Nocardia pseudobrasiliensis]|uniref:Integrase-like protein n=1 Tax=Nocardia pseudobrasiliensis TaxID=45979 RepID=A0A370I4W9_9NOCA|nr:tyrosine-type recombinase/integrase [Nocardia pseudobrasiliensis]RDI65788.1 integrase-like protein [Nocardia pseudobrasiliensis]